MNYQPRQELDANLTKLYGRGCNAHPDVQYFPRRAGYTYISNLSQDALIGGPHKVHGVNLEIFIVRYTAIDGRTYVAQSWVTGLEFSFNSVGALKRFLSGKDTTH